MNTINETEVLKALLPEPSQSIYRLEKDLKEKLEKQKIKVNYPTLRRRINKLIKEGLIEAEKGIRKNGKVDERKTKNLGLSFKGLVSLILKADLSESESRAVVQRVLSKPQFQKLQIAKLSSAQNIPTASLEKSFKELRPRVNLEYFDEEYVKQLLFENLIIENMLNQLIEWKQKHLDSLPKQKLRLLRKEAKKDAKKLPSESVEQLFTTYEYLREKRQSWDNKILLLKPVVNLFHKMGYRPKTFVKGGEKAE